MPNYSFEVVWSDENSFHNNLFFHECMGVCCVSWNFSFEDFVLQLKLTLVPICGVHAVNNTLLSARPFFPPHFISPIVYLYACKYKNWDDTAFFFFFPPSLQALVSVYEDNDRHSRARLYCDWGLGISFSSRRISVQYLSHLFVLLSGKKQKTKHHTEEEGEHNFCIFHFSTTVCAHFKLDWVTKTLSSG